MTLLQEVRSPQTCSHIKNTTVPLLLANCIPWNEDFYELNHLYNQYLQKSKNQLKKHKNS
jgi:hypothetical protein